MGRLQLRFDMLLLLTVAKYVLLCIIFAASLMWVLWWMMVLEPPNKDTKYLQMLDKHIHSRFFRTDGYYGSSLIYQSAVFIMVALLSYGVIELRKKIKLLGGNRRGRERLARPRLTTYPLIIWGPFGVVTAAEALCVAGLLFLLLYSFGRPTYIYIQNLYKLDPKTLTASLQLEKLDGASYYMGRAAMISFSLLWIPISRGSPFLRLINVPFENAIKYHIWLSVMTLSMLTLHSIGYIIYYVLSHTWKEIIGWRAEAESCSVVAGLVAWIVGLIMWATSLSFFRRRWYEVFFGVHHLYIVFFIFWLYHVMWTVHLFIIPCLLFAIDRFLRMVQSRQSVDVLSARIMESGSIELKIARNNSKAYHPLSSWYLQCPSLTRLMKYQWHFFSVISTGLDGKEALSIVIKPLGNWTNRLREQVLESTKGANAVCPFSFKAAVEGPYGDESDFFLRYNVIVLVGGGIGVTPLLAILQDVLHRKRLGEDNLPISIHLHHCVRKQEELCVLNSVDPNLILPHYEKQGLDIRVNAYVTSPSCMSSQGNGCKDDQKTLDLATFGGSPIRQQFSNSPDLRTPTISSSIAVNTLQKSTPIQGICAISTSGNSKWVFLTILASLVGFYIIWGLSNVLLIKKYDARFPNYHRANLVVASMALGVSLFGGMISLLWRSHVNVPPNEETDNTVDTMLPLSQVPQKSSPLSSVGSYPNATHLSNENHHHEVQRGLANDIENAGSLVGSPWNGNLHLQSRPEWRDIFHSLSIEYRRQNIGVLVSGPPSMQQDIAEECRRHDKVMKGDSSSNAFHFHSISFSV